jgi:hypothetical protein
MEFTNEEVFGKAETKAKPEPGSSASAHHTAAVAGAGTAGSHEATRHEGHVGPSGHETIDLEHLDLDDLSSRIYSRLRSKLRLELLVDRERAGFLTDFR